MEIFQMRYFMAVMKYKSFSNAAQNLLVSQPSVSRAISQLERDLGVELFVRNGKRIIPTKAGRILYEHLEVIMPRIDELPDILRISSASQQSTILTINVLSASLLIPKLLSAFKGEYPSVNFKLIQDKNEEKYDLCIISTIPGAMIDNSALMFNEEIVLAIPTSSKFCGHTPISLQMLKHEDFIMPTVGSALYSVMRHFFSLCGYVPNVVWECENPYVVRGLVEMGLGISIWPVYSWGDLHSNKAKLVTVSSPICQRNVLISWPKHRVPKKESKLFIQFAINFFKDKNKLSSIF